MARFVAVVGARSLPASWASRVVSVVRWLLERGFGIGIRQSLATRYRQAVRWSHIQAIVNALQKEYSRHPDRGLGLFMVAQIVGAYRGSLHLRSGARLYLRHRARRLAASPFPGTQLAISLSARGAQKRP